MVQKSAVVAGVLMLLLWCSNSRATPTEIVWAANVSPPFHIVDGPLAQQGVCDAFLGAMIAALPEVEHRINYLPQMRIGMLWEQEQNICFPCMIHRSQEQRLIAYSEPTHTYPSHGIITRPSLVHELTEKYGNPIDFEAMLRDQGYRFGQPIGRMYGKLQPILERHLLGTSKHVNVAGESANTSMMTMILGERLDFTIDYPMVKTFFEQTEGRKLAFIPIAQVAHDEILGAVACTRNSWGEETIKRINKVIPEVQNDSNFQHAKELWLQPE